MQEKNAVCVGPESAEAGIAPSCQGCPNAAICASAPKGPDPDIELIKHRLSGVKNIVMVISGKGGVGKSTLTKELAFALGKKGLSVGVVDLDICGPSLPRLSGVRGEDAHQSAAGIEPILIDDSVVMMSMHYLLGDKNEAILFRGPQKNGVIKMFLKDVIWGDLDIMLVDTPPGTSDEHITAASIFQQCGGVQGAVLITTPQMVAEADVRREVNFCQKAKLPVLGIIENMSGFLCPNCKGSSVIFPLSHGEGAGKRLSDEFQIPLWGKVPLDPILVKACDEGIALNEVADSTSPTMKALDCVTSKLVAALVASFVLECAHAGRWVRGFLALQGSLHSEEKAINHARLQLASAVLEKNWQIALSLVKTRDIDHVDALSYFLYKCSKNSEVPHEVCRGVVSTFLCSAKQFPDAQNSLFQSAIRWTSWKDAIEYYSLLESPQPQSAKELAHWLRVNQTIGRSEKQRTIDSVLVQLQSYEKMIKRDKNGIRKQAPDTSEANNALLESKSIRLSSVMKLAKATLLGEGVSWKLPLTLLSGHRVVEDSQNIIVKMIGMCCPQLWREAIEVFGAENKLALWVASRHDWRTALIVSQNVLLTNREKCDLFRQCATPNSILFKLASVSRATRKLSEPTKKAIAVQLASGYLLEELQLSSFSKTCQRIGDWESSLLLYKRIPTPEFQKRAMNCILENQQGVTSTELLRLVNERNTATTHTASTLIKHSANWQEALYALYYMMSRGTRCNPQILSAFMDMKPPLDVTAGVLERQKRAANDRILRRFEEMKRNGTSGLRKKVKVFKEENYLANFVQSTFTALKKHGGIPDTLLVGGDGRYFLTEAVQTIIKVAAGNGVSNVWVGKNGVLSTPAVSNIIRKRTKGSHKAKGAFILTASHNPGGPEEDFGIKYNTENGGPAPEKLTSDIYEETLRIKNICICNNLPVVDIGNVGEQSFEDFNVDVIDSTKDYVDYMKSVFNFDVIKNLLHRPDFTIQIDGLNGVSGPYIKDIFYTSLGVPETSLKGAIPLPDFGGHHPDPNLTYAKELVTAMGLNPDGTPVMNITSKIPSFAAAFDGDADRNMILGDRFFVTPSDSVAILAAHSNVVPFFTQNGGLKAVARSMPTSGALDRVASAKNLKLFEVPTGWKYFGNLMDSHDVFGSVDYNPLICGEESFGTGSNHVREKDGIWAALFWLSIIANKNVDPSKPLVGVQQIVEEHWIQYGRNYYCRYDYENVTEDAGNAVMDLVGKKKPEEIPSLRGKKCVKIDNFEYHDSVDGSVSKNQGIRVMFEDGSRFVIRLSGTGSSGATIRLYLEQYMESNIVEDHIKKNDLPITGKALGDLISIALNVAQIAQLTGRDAPTVIT